MCRALAGEAQAAFISVSPSDVLSKFVGESEASIRGLFATAYEKASRMESKCAVLFLDEIDALGISRCSSTSSGGGNGDQGGSNGESSSRRLLAELLIQMSQLSSQKRFQNNGPGLEDFGDNNNIFEGEDDNIDNNQDGQDSGNIDEFVDTNSNCGQGVVDESDNPARVIVVAATNRISDCDSALLRRFGIRVHVGLPTEKDRKKILKRLLKKIDNIMSKEDFDLMASETEGWSGSEIECLIREASMAPVRECIREAALVKRKAKRRKQDKSTSHDLEQDDGAKEAQACMVEGMSSLRPVTVRDFKRAFMFFQSGGNVSNLEDGVQYDSSDSSEDEDEEEDLRHSKVD